MSRLCYATACSLLAVLLTLFSGLAMHWHHITAHVTPDVTANSHDHSHSHGHSHHTNTASIHRCGHRHHHHDHTHDDASRDHESNQSPASTPIPTDHDCRLCDMIASVVGMEDVETLATHLFDLSHRLAAIEGERAPHLLSLTLRAGRGPPTFLKPRFV